MYTAEARGSPDIEVIGKAARLYYEYGLTHQQVAEILHISRVKVTRLLKQARNLGLVQIRVLQDASPYAAVETELAEHFKVDEVVVVPTIADEREQRAALATAAARYLQRVLRDGMTVTIGLSRTIALVPHFVVDARPVSATFVPLVGGLRRVSMAANPYEAAERLAQLFGGDVEHLLAPAIAGSPAIAKAFRSDPASARTLARAAQADIALLGVGGVTSHTTLVDEGELTAEEMSELVKAGAVGDIGGRFFDTDGAPVVHPIDKRVVGLTLAEIRLIPLRIVVAGGPHKVAALRAVLRGGLAAVVVLDVETAQQILQEGSTKERR